MEEKIYYLEEEVHHLHAQMHGLYDIIYCLLKMDSGLSKEQTDYLLEKLYALN